MLPKIGSCVIGAPLIDIMKRLQQESPLGLPSQIGDIRNKDLSIACPQHKGGQEGHPSCQVFVERNDPRIEYGTAHCFVCGYRASLLKLVSDCLQVDISQAKKWLKSFFGSSSKEALYLPPLEDSEDKPKTLDPQILETFWDRHPYMYQRGLSDEVLDRFQIKYDPVSSCVVFPVWDEKSNLVMLTRRSVKNKHFFIPAGIEKPVYLLDKLLAEPPSVVAVCESQINCLTCWTYGLPAIALFGTGSTHQLEMLNKSPLRNYVLLFDGDEAGRRGARRFISEMRSDVFITDVLVPRGKDVNDLSREQFWQLLNSYKVVDF